jgi:hypothetical protein
MYCLIKNDYLYKFPAVSNEYKNFFDEFAFIFDENIYICDEYMHNYS